MGSHLEKHFNLHPLWFFLCRSASGIPEWGEARQGEGREAQRTSRKGKWRLLILFVIQMKMGESGRDQVGSGGRIRRGSEGVRWG